MKVWGCGRKASSCSLAILLALSTVLIGCQEEVSISPMRNRAATRSKGTAEALRASFDQLKDEELDQDLALTQSGARLNQWLLNQPSDPNWKVDPLIKTLPEEFHAGVGEERKKPYDDLRYHPQLDGAYLRENIWLHQIASSRLAQQPSDLELAQRLFDWTVRHIQLEPAETNPEAPWKVILRGRGSALERAWVFMLLGRQQGLNIVLLATKGEEERPQPWLPALLSDGQLYLFDTQLGLAIPGPDGKGVATLEQVRADDALLRQLDLQGSPYPVSADEIKELVVFLEGSPFALSRRMELIEAQLSTEQRVVLTTDPSAQAKQLHAIGLTDVRLWQVPFNTLLADIDALQADPPPVDFEMINLLSPTPLRRARLLQFRGDYGGDEGAKQFYMQGRMSSSELDRAAVELRLQAVQIQLVSDSKQAASYWLGLVTFEEGDYKAAIDHLQKRTLEASPDGPWTTGARYNLGRAYEALGQIDQAVALYKMKGSPQDHGNRLRAKWLQEGKIKPEVEDRRAA